MTLIFLSILSAQYILGRQLGISKGGISLKKFPTSKMGNITMQGVRFLYSSTMDALKMEQLNEGLINLAGIDIISSLW